MTNANRQQMKGKLLDLRARKKQLQKKGRGLCNQITPLINPNLNELCDMDIAEAASVMDDLVMIQAELLQVNSKIKQLEEALYG